MTIFVIIVTFNAAKWIDFCLGSLRSSSLPVIPLVIDNDSSDNTVALIKEKYSECILIECSENLGFGKANNIGIKHAIEHGYDYIFLLNQDAAILPDTIEKLIYASRKYPNFFIISPIHLDGTRKALDYNFSNYLLKGESHKLLSSILLKNEYLSEVYSVKFVNAALWLLTNKCVEIIGGFDPIFPHYGEDDDYINRVLYHGYQVGVCLNAYGIHNRPQIIINDNPIYKTASRRYIAYLIELKNINNTFFVSLAKVFVSFSISVLINIKNKEIKSIAFDFKAIILILINLFKIYKRREDSKKKSSNFLKIRYKYNLLQNHKA